MPPEQAERRLAAIMFTDIVGYTALMARDEEAARRARDRHQAVARPLVERQHGRWIEATGDESLSSFPSALDAVSAALAIQEALRDDAELTLRIGIHQGDVTFEGERVSGGGVNLAARIRPLAEPGGICVSDEVQHSLRGRTDLAFAPLGERELKNVGRSIGVYAVTRRDESARAAGTSGDLALPGMDELTVPGFGGAPAIAVLPFDNLSADPDQEYFADGIAEDLITRLASWRDFPVIARNSSFTYKGRAVLVKQVSQELGARYLVEGSVRRADDRVRISAQLIDATTGHHLWAETYDRELRDIFAVQDEITEAIVVSMSSGLTLAEMQRAVREGPRSTSAYDLFMRGWWHLNRQSAEDNATARSLFERAVELDPQLARAFTGLALAHWLDLFLQWSDEPARSIDELARAAQRSVALDDRDPLAQLALGAAYSFTEPRGRLIPALERAVRLNPSLPLARSFLGTYLVFAGRPEDGIAHLETALRLSPHDPLKYAFLESVALAHFAAGRYEDAADWARRSIQENPDYPWVYGGLATACAHLGRIEDARRAFGELARLIPGISTASLTGLFAGATPDFLERYVDGLRRAGLPEE